MDTAPFDSRSEADASPSGERLDSWKEIASYLKRSVRTLHRWEKDEGLPVHRQVHKELGSVFAYKSELDAWSRTRTTRAELKEENDARASAPRSFLIAALALTSAVCVTAALNIMPQWTGDANSLYFYQVRPHQAFRRISIPGGVSQEIAPWSWSRQPFAAVDSLGRMAVHSVIDRGRLQASRLRDLDNGEETALPFALYLNRFSRDGRWLAGESREGEVVVCEISSGRCRPLTPQDDQGLAALAWSGDGTRLFLLRHTKAQTFGDLASVTVDGGEVKTYGPIGPFQQRYLMSMDASPRDEIVFARCQDGPHELWLARLR